MLENKLMLSRVFVAILSFTYALLFFQNSSKDSVSRTCGIGEFAYGLWALFAGLRPILTDQSSQILVQSVIYILAEIASCAFISFTLGLYSEPTPFIKKFSKYIFIFPAFSLVLAVCFEVFSVHHLFILPNELLPVIEQDPIFQKSAYYFIHCAVDFSFIGLAIVFSIFKMITKPKANRSIMLLYAAAALLYLVQIIYKIHIEHMPQKEYTALTHFLSLFSWIFFSTVVFFAVYFDKREQGMRLASDQILDSSKFPVFIFSDDDLFISANVSGFEFLTQYGIAPRTYQHYREIFSEAQFLHLGVPEAADSKNAFYISAITDKKLYYGKKTELHSVIAKNAGYYIILANMDMYSGIINQLEYVAHTDEHTNCKRGSQLEAAFLKEAHEHAEPLIIICARLNNLEHLNETIGIKKTDLYLVTFADIIKNAVQQTDLQDGIEKAVFRMTGSVFALIASVRRQEQIQAFFKQIKRECAAFSKNRVEPLSCSLGYAVSTDKAQPLGKMLQKSFDNMLLDK